MIARQSVLQERFAASYGEQIHTIRSSRRICATCVFQGFENKLFEARTDQNGPLRSVCVI